MYCDLKTSVARQRLALFNMLVEPMAFVARRCAEAWPERDRLDAILLEGLRTIPHSRYLYALDTDAVQVSSNAAAEGLIGGDFGRDRSQRPYMREPVPEHGLLLSEAYISLRVKRPSLTAVQRIERNGMPIGFLGADFDLRNLPLTREVYREPNRWRQLKGDPAIRGSLFDQQRVESLLDRNIGEVLSVLEELVIASGVFHCKIHFSSSRATIWLMDDPFRYRLLGYEALADPDVCLVYPHHDYPADAAIPAAQIRPILDGFRRLRYADEVIYLRSGSLNIFNGMISLNFSCDGSHYLPHDEFLNPDSPFWQSVG
ncbi:hypothetical protein F2Q65_11130 [Thiohalocapsa marina]|uniref:Uncharacterized protein n=1 Tax=Thiohalocapsa marina TaxID=424902 RepID=A0A5M8FMB6_9GAMM|nr:PDC sensor domain-containing protein [Thiohalocapsa marina]KAA6184856.1 hypothetical protein F2Q65_11130 [Thiohalocapsa marina]